MAIDYNRIEINQKVNLFDYDWIDGFHTCVMLIEKEECFYLIDTFCGSDSMKPIMEWIAKKPEKEVVVINTHSHWDHVWGGNGCFNEDLIVAHNLCKEKMETEFDAQLEKK